MARLELDAICKGWEFPVIDRLSITVEEGEFFVVVGPSGIGKTTLLRCIAGLERLDAGRVLIGGTDVTEVKPYRRRVAMTFESYALYPHLTVFENIASPLRARRVKQPELRRTVREVAELLRIDPLLDRRPNEISGGQKQRTALGRTLVARPDIFLLDEPISHLDAKIRHELRRQFHTLEELRRVATVYVTHDYAEALSLGDRIGVMGDGGLVQVGPPREVFRRPVDLFVARHLGQPSINEVPCRLTREGEGLFAAADTGQIRFPVSARHAAALNGAAAAEVTVGLRPQHLRVLEGPAPVGVPALSGRVHIFETLGASGVLIADCGGARLTVMTAPQAHFAPGADVTLTFDPDTLYFFAARGGRNLVL